MLYLIVFAPIIVGGAAVMALLLGAGTAAAWEAIETRPPTRRPAVGPTRSLVDPSERTRPRAA
jgi:hypothetical protein